MHFYEYACAQKSMPVANSFRADVHVLTQRKKINKNYINKKKLKGIKTAVFGIIIVSKHYGSLDA